MLLSSSNTGSMDLRDTDVQPPKTTSTFSFSISSRAFSANRGQFDAGSTTTGSSFLPSKPPFLFCSSMSINTVSFSVVSLIAMVPDSECRTPTLMVSSAASTDAEENESVVHSAASDKLNTLFMILLHNCIFVIQLQSYKKSAKLKN
ncbi:hypothetical protein VCR9J2_40041 [Vibrio crassostreae]|nr:hypothetical protein VCR9J2_40041 [Vibrio crassostreae]